MESTDPMAPKQKKTMRYIYEANYTLLFIQGDILLPVPSRMPYLLTMDL